MATQMFTVADRPELVSEGIPTEQVWPEYNVHGEVTRRLWPRLYADVPQFQFGLYDDATGELVAEGHTVPCWWDGNDVSLSSGVDETLEAAFERFDAGGAVNTLCALAAEVPPHSRGRGLARSLLQGMRTLAAEWGLERLIAPVRPSMKDRYPITPIERYVTWRRGDGQPFDPWVRVHVALGARIGPTLPRSLHVTGSVAEWESWTDMTFPASGEYVFPFGLAPLTIDHETDTGDYWEPNVWMLHP